MKLDKKFFSENIKTLFYALIIAVIIRSLLVQPFYIPSSSMEPTLLVGDRLFVTKYSYGYSKHSFPFSPPILSKRIMFKSPERGDVIVFKTPADNRTDYIKRLIGLPGDKIQFIDANLYLNSSEILKSKIPIKTKIYCGDTTIDVLKFEEKLPNGKKFHTVYLKNYTYQNSDIFTVPDDHYFFLGDNPFNRITAVKSLPASVFALDLILPIVTEILASLFVRIQNEAPSGERFPIIGPCTKDISFVLVDCGSLESSSRGPAMKRPLGRPIDWADLDFNSASSILSCARRLNIST